MGKIGVGGVFPFSKQIAFSFLFFLFVFVDNSNMPFEYRNFDVKQAEEFKE